MQIAAGDQPEISSADVAVSQASYPFRRRMAPVVSHAGLVAIPLLTWLLFDDPVITLTVGGTVVLPGYLILARYEARRSTLLITPLTFYFAFHSVGLGLAAFHAAARVSEGHSLAFSTAMVSPEHLAAGYIISLIGSVSLHCGMQITRPLLQKIVKDTSEVDSGLDVRRSRGMLVTLYLVGIMVRWGGALFSFAGAAIGFLQWSTNSVMCAVVLASMSRSSRTARFWMFIAAGTAVELVWGVSAESKSYIMFSFLPIILLFARGEGLRRWFPVLCASLAILYLAVVAPVVTSARAVAATGENEAFSTTVIRAITDGDDRDGDESSQLDAFLGRTFVSVAVGFIYGEVERDGTRGGDSLDYLGYAMIPRFLWPEKPWVTRGAWFTVYLGFSPSEDEATTATAQTAAGELFWNFGWLGVVIGMLTLGAGIGTLWRVAGNRPHEQPLKLMLFFSVVFGMLEMSEAGSVLITIVNQLLVLGGLIWLVGRLERRANRARP